MNGSRCQGVDASDFLFRVVLQSLSTGPTVTIWGRQKETNYSGMASLGVAPSVKGLLQCPAFCRSKPWCHESSVWDILRT